MEPSTKPTSSLPSSNPPSVEVAYKRKCIALKKRLNEIEAENEMMRIRNRRGWQYIQKMRLESCILLERLANVTGMTEEAKAGVNPELRARATAMMSNAASLNGGQSGTGNGGAYFEDETEGSSDEQPPTPQERPLRVKRSRKSNINDNMDDDGADNGPDSSRAGSASLPRLAPAPTQEEMTSSFRIQTGSNGSGNERDTQKPDDKDNSESRNGAAPHLGPEPSTTPMEMDTNEPREESQG